MQLRDGTVLAAVPTKGLFRVEDFTAQLLPSPPEVKELVRVLFEDSTGTLWAGSEQKLLARAPGADDRLSTTRL